MPEGFRKRVVPFPVENFHETSDKVIEPLGQGGFNVMENDVATLKRDVSVDCGEEVIPLVNVNDHRENPNEVAVPAESIKCRLRKRKTTSIKDRSSTDHGRELTPAGSIKSRLRNAKVPANIGSSPTEVDPQLVTRQFDIFYRDSEDDHPL